MATTAQITSLTTQKSRLLDLPAELRNEVYTNTISGSKATFLHAPRVHPLLQVCQQIRTEARSAYFAETEFILIVASDVHVRKSQRTGIPLEHSNHLYKPERAGTILNMPQIGKSLGSSGAIFGKVRLHLYTTYNIVHEKRDHESLQLTSLGVEYVDGKLAMKQANGPSHPNRLKSRPVMNYFHPRQPSTYDAEDIDAALEAAKAKASKIGGREGFNRLTLNDLKGIARGCRLDVIGGRS